MKVTKLIAGPLLALTLTPGLLAAQELTEISIAVSSGSLPSGVGLMASHMGLFEKHGLKAVIVPMESASVATMAMLSGSTDFSSGGVADVILAASKGQDLIAVESEYRGFAGLIIVSDQIMKERGLDASLTPEEKFRAMDGMSIASPSATSTFTFALKGWSEAEGISLNFVFMGSTAMGSALATGAVDAVITSAPFYVEPILNGKAHLWLNGAQGDIPDAFLPAHAAVLKTTRAFAQANPDIIDKVRAVSEEFASISIENPELVKKAITENFPVTPEAVDFILAHESFGSKGQPLTIDDMRKEIAFLEAAGVELPEDLDPVSMVWRGE